MQPGNLVRLSESPRPEGAEWSPLEWFLCLKATEQDTEKAWGLKALDGKTYVVKDSNLKKEYNFKELEFSKAEDLVEYLQLLNLKLDISNAYPKGPTEAELMQQQMNAYAAAVKHSMTTTVSVSPYTTTYTAPFTTTGTAGISSGLQQYGNSGGANQLQQALGQINIWPFGNKSK